MDPYFRLLEELTPGVQPAPDPATFLAPFRKTGFLIDLCRYQIEVDLKLNGSNYGQRHREKFYDATFNFCLTRDSILVASIGFELDESDLIVWQIQGVRGQKEALQALRWERALLSYTMNFARERGLERVVVVPSARHKWAETEGHLERQHAHLLYDVTAKRMGFSRDDDGYLVKALC